MTSPAISGRKPGWRPSSVGIGSSLTLSGGGNKPSPYLDQDLSFTIPSKPFYFPKVGSNDRRAKSAPKHCWKNPQASAKLLLTCCPVSTTDQHTDIHSLPYDNPDFQKWAKKPEYYKSTGMLVEQKEQLQEVDEDFLLEIDNVRKQIQKSPDHLICSIKAAMAEKRKRIITSKAAQLFTDGSTSRDACSNSPEISAMVETCSQQHLEGGMVRKVKGSGHTVMSYHQILCAAISNNWKDAYLT